MPGAASGFVCPGCGGALWEVEGDRIVRFRCHNGHGYTAESLVAEQTSDLETALWTGLRALEEHADLRRRMARRAAQRHMTSLVRDYERQARESEERAGVLRRLLVSEPHDVAKMPKSQPTAAHRDKQTNGAKPKRRKKQPHSRTSAAAVASGNGSKRAPVRK
jgi:two-component system, chemotaxis family, protein-glutamate methylesterase/glutaminase